MAQNRDLSDSWGVWERMSGTAAIERNCPDCGAPIHGEFCHACGEKAEPNLFSVGHYIREVVQEFVSLDTKFFQTIPALLVRPGFLTEEFVVGRRKRYLAPVRLYMLVAFVSFFALGYFLRNEVAPNVSITNQGNHYSFNLGLTEGPVVGGAAQHKADALFHVILEISPYVLLLVTTPAFALILQFLYWKRGKLYGEHLIFSFHFFAFALPVLIASVIISNIYVFSIGEIFFLCYLYFALRRFYRDRGALLLLRTLACTTAYFTITILTCAATMMLSYEIAVLIGQLPKSG